MPHVIVEYSANLEERADISSLLAALHAAALASGMFEIGGIRVRAARLDHAIVGDADPENAFVHVVIRIGHGRPLEKREQMAKDVFAAASRALDQAFAKGPLALQLEVQEIDPVLSYKRNNIHERIKAKAAASKESAA